jgi:hypothetical protein
VPILLGWASRTTEVVLTNEDAWAMVDRARRFDTTAGGRFELRGGRSIMVWAAEEPAGPARRMPLALIEIAWRTPDPDHATIAQVAWNARVGAAEAEAWQALEVLLGRSIDPAGRKE